MASGKLTLQPDATDGVDAPIINGSYAANNYQNFTLVALGTTHALGVDTYSRLVASFDISTLSGKTISGAALTLYSDGSGTATSGTYTCKRLTQTAWTEAGVTWNRYDGTNNWTTAGGDATSTNQVQVTANGNATSLVFTGMGPMVTAALAAGLTRLHVLVSGPEITGSSSYYNGLTSDTATGAERPKLVVDYFTETYAVEAMQLFTPGMEIGAGQLCPL